MDRQPADYHTKRSKSEKGIALYEITDLWNLKHNTDELVYKTETDSQTWRTDCGCRRGLDWEPRLADANHYT